MILLCILVCFGLTMIIVESVIFSPIRQFLGTRFGFFRSLLTCMLCTGTWIGFVFSFYYNPFDVTHNIIDNFVCAIFYATTTWFLHLTETNYGT